MKKTIVICLTFIVFGCSTAREVPQLNEKADLIQVHESITSHVSDCEKLGPISADLKGTPWTEVEGKTKLFTLLKLDAHNRYKEADTIAMLGWSGTDWKRQGIAYKCFK